LNSALQLDCPQPDHVGTGRLSIALVGLLAATGSVVFIEPAPYDVLAIAMFIGLPATGLRFPRGLQAPVILLGLFMTGNILATVMAPDPMESIRSLSVRFYMVLTWLMLASLVAGRPRNILAALWAGYLVAALIAVAWGTLEYLGLIHNELWQGGLRARGAFKDPNVYGPFLIPAAIHAVRKIATGAVRNVAIYLPVFLLLCFGILLSFSRGAWIDFATALMLYILFAFIWAPNLRTRINWILSVVATISLMVAVVVAAVSVDVIGNRFFQRAVLEQKYDIKAGGRFDSQLKAGEHIGRDPIGVGPGRSDEEFGLEPHNMYLQVLVEAGWLGGLSLILFFALTGYRLIRLLRYPHPLRTDVFIVTACLTGLVAQSFFIDSTHWRHLWLLFAVAWGLIISCRRSQFESVTAGFMSKPPDPPAVSRYPVESVNRPAPVQRSAS